MVEGVENKEVTPDSSYSKLYGWVMTKLESTLNALYLVASSRVQGVLAEKAASTNSVNEFDKKSKSKAKDNELKADDLEDAFRKLSVKNTVEPAIVVGKIERAAEKRELYENLKDEHEKLLEKKNKLLDSALGGNKDKLNSNFSKILQNVRSQRKKCEDDENLCRVYATTGKLLDEMCKITLDSCKGLNKAGDVLLVKNALSEVVDVESSRSNSFNSTIDDLSD